MTNDSIKLAQLWLSLREIKDQLDNEILPISGYLEVSDLELITAMEQLSKKIDNHFNKFKLAAEPRITQQKTAL
jgi:hypothetical protein